MVVPHRPSPRVDRVCPCLIRTAGFSCCRRCSPTATRRKRWNEVGLCHIADEISSEVVQMQHLACVGWTWAHIRWTVSVQVAEMI